MPSTSTRKQRRRRRNFIHERMCPNCEQRKTKKRFWHKLFCGKCIEPKNDAIFSVVNPMTIGNLHGPTADVVNPTTTKGTLYSPTAAVVNPITTVDNLHIPTDVVNPTTTKEGTLHVPTKTKQITDMFQYIKTVQVKNNQHLQRIVRHVFDAITYGEKPKYYLSKLDVSNVTNMDYLFRDCNFNIDDDMMQYYDVNISDWNVSNVTSMKKMFQRATLSSEINIMGWRVFKVKHAKQIFDETEYIDQCNVHTWIISPVADEYFNSDSQPIKLKKISLEEIATHLSTQRLQTHDPYEVVTTTFQHFHIPNTSYYRNELLSLLKKHHAALYSDLGLQVPLYKVRDADHLREIVEEMKIAMYKDEDVDYDFSQLDVSNVTDMNHLFYAFDFNRGIENNFPVDISNWDVSHVINMKQMFAQAQLHKTKINVGNWQVFKVINLDHILLNASINNKNGFDKWVLSPKTEGFKENNSNIHKSQQVHLPSPILLETICNTIINIENNDLQSKIASAFQLLKIPFETYYVNEFYRLLTLDKSDNYNIKTIKDGICNLSTFHSQS